MPEEATQVLAQFGRTDLRAASGPGQGAPARTVTRCPACALCRPPGEETDRGAGIEPGAIERNQRIGGDRLSLAGATLFNGYLITAVTMCDAHRSTMTHVTRK
jgi:hypothetical protein